MTPPHEREPRGEEYQASYRDGAWWVEVLEHQNDGSWWRKIERCHTQAAAEGLAEQLQREARRIALVESTRSTCLEGRAVG